MKNIFYFMLGICLIMLTSATTVSVMTFKPSTPKYTIVVSSWDTDGLNDKIKPYIKNGYIVKTISAGDNARVALLEKY